MGDSWHLANLTAIFCQLRPHFLNVWREMGKFFQGLFLALRGWLWVVEIYILDESIIEFVKFGPILGHCCFGLLLGQPKPKLFLHILEIVVGLALEKLGCIPFLLGLILIDEAADVPSLPNVGGWQVFILLCLHNRLRHGNRNDLPNILCLVGQGIFVWRWAPKCDCFFLLSQFRSRGVIRWLWRILLWFFLFLWNISFSFT